MAFDGNNNESDNELDEGQTTTTATRNAAICDTSDRAPAGQRPITCASQSIMRVAKKIYSNDLDEVLTCIRELSRVLEKDANPETHLLVIQDHVPRFVELLQYDHRPDIQAPVCDILTNLVGRTTELRRRVMTAGAGPAFLRLLNSASVSVLFASVQGLSSIARWCNLTDVSDALTEQGVLLRLAVLAGRSVSERVLGGVCKCLTHIFNLSPLSPEDTETCFLAIKHLLGSNFHSVELAACGLLSTVTNGREDYTQTMIDLGVLERLTDILAQPRNHQHLLAPVLCTLNNIAAVGYSQAEAVITCDVLSSLKSILSYGVFIDHVPIVLRILETSTKYNGKLGERIAHSRVLSCLLGCLKNEKNAETQHKAARIVQNITRSDPLSVICNGAAGLSDILTHSEDCQLMLITLQTLHYIMCALRESRQGRSKYYYEYIRDLKLIYPLQRAQRVDDQETADKAVEVAAEWWDLANYYSEPPLEPEADPLNIDYSPVVQPLRSNNMSAIAGSVNKLYVLLFDGVHRVSRFIHYNDVTRLVGLLQIDDRPQLQTRITLVIMSLISRSMTTKLIRHIDKVGAYRHFIRNLKATNTKLVHATVRTVGLIVSVEPLERDTLAKHGVIQALLSIVDNHIDEEPLMEAVSLCLYHLFQHSPSPFPAEVRATCLVATKQLLKKESSSVVLNAASVLAVMTKQRDEFCRQQVMHTDVLHRLIQIINRSKNGDRDILRPALTTVTNIVIANGNRQPLPDVIACDALVAIHSLIARAMMSVCAVSAAVDITATGNRDLIKAVINADWASPLIGVLTDRSRAQEGAAQVIYNITYVEPFAFVTSCDRILIMLMIQILRRHNHDSAEMTKLAMGVLSNVVQPRTQYSTRCKLLDALFDKDTHISTELQHCLKNLRKLANVREIRRLAEDLIGSYEIGRENYGKIKCPDT